MAYTKHTWQCGESISADLLNHMEQGIEDASGGGSCDCGYECVDGTFIPYIDESVTTTPDGYYNYSRGSMSTYIPSWAKKIKVIFNGTEYICPYDDDAGAWGAPWDNDAENYDWSVYPFSIFNDEIDTQNSGTYGVKIDLYRSNLMIVDGNTITTKSNPSDPYACTVASENAYGLFESGKLKITFEGTEYICDKTVIAGSGTPQAEWGAQTLDFSDYPFLISIQQGDSHLTLCTLEAGMYAYTVERIMDNVEFDECFNNASRKSSVLEVVKDAVSPVMLEDALNHGMSCIFINTSNKYEVYYLTSYSPNSGDNYEAIFTCGSNTLTFVSDSPYNYYHLPQY